MDYQNFAVVAVHRHTSTHTRTLTHTHDVTVVCGTREGGVCGMCVCSLRQYLWMIACACANGFPSTCTANLFARLQWMLPPLAPLPWQAGTLLSGNATATASAAAAAAVHCSILFRNLPQLEPKLRCQSLPHLQMRRGAPCSALRQV